MLPGCKAGIMFAAPEFRMMSGRYWLLILNKISCYVNTAEYLCLQVRGMSANRSNNMKNIVNTIVVICSMISIVSAHTNIAHTHIGVNPTWRPDLTALADPASASDPDPTDDNQLWLFSLPPMHAVAPTPGWPDWSDAQGRPFLLLTPFREEGELIYKDDNSGKCLWKCEFDYSKANGYGDESGVEHLDGWHSASGPQGKWDLAGGSAEQEPGWDIYLVRKCSSVAEEDFLMLLPGDLPVLTADGESYHMGKEFGGVSWEIHSHMGFGFWLAPDFAGEVSATFYVYDAGGMYQRSADYTFRFATEVCVAPAGDIDGNCQVDLRDLAVLAQDWLSVGLYHE